jgi:hypothetical protein
MNALKMLIWALAVLFLLGGCATSQPHPAQKDWQELCDRLDKDRKGAITKKDFVSGARDQKEAAKLFEMCDTNQDEKLSFDEYLARQRLINNLFELPPPPQVIPQR